MRRADGRDERDDLYCALGNHGLSAGCEGGPVTEDDMVRLLDRIAGLRLRVTERRDYMRVLWGISQGTGERTYVALYEDATGISDDEVFDELAFPHGSEDWTVEQHLHEHFHRQRVELRQRGYPLPEGEPAHARPGLHRLPPDDPAFDEPRQLMLPNMKHRWLP